MSDGVFTTNNRFSFNAIGDECGLINEGYPILAGGFGVLASKSDALIGFALLCMSHPNRMDVPTIETRHRVAK